MWVFFHSIKPNISIHNAPKNLTKPKIIYCLQIILLSFQTSFTEQIFKISLVLSDIFIFQKDRTIISDIHLETYATLERERTN